MTWTVADIPDLSGRRVVVTGGSAGLGLQVATTLAGRGADVILTSRSASRAAAAAAAIRRAVPRAAVTPAVLDLADLASVGEFAAAIVAGGALDILINNAGLMALPRRMATRDGFEMQFGANHLGHFALTNLLLPALRRCPPRARVVVVSSVAHRRGRIRFDDPNWTHGYRPGAAYAQSKLANLMFARELDRRLRADGVAVDAVAAHPGVVVTDLIGPMLAGSSAPKRALIRAVMHLISHDLESGAAPLLQAATDPTLRGGAYLGPDGWLELRGAPAPARISRRAKDPQAAKRLWRLSSGMQGP